MSHKKRVAIGAHWTWRQVKYQTMRMLDDMNTSNTMVLAAGISYFCALAFFPLFAAGLAIATIVITADQAEAAIRNINMYLPRDIAALLSSQLAEQTGRYSGGVIVASLAIAVSLFGASAAMANTIRSLNVIYKVKETRHIVKMRARSVIMLLCALMVITVILALLIIDRYMVMWGVPSLLVEIVIFVRWPVMLLLMGLAFTVLYRYGPNRPRAKWHWASWGASAATLLWLIATLGLFAYTRMFATFDESYTLFAGIIVLMIWFNLSALALLIGGHINHRVELHQQK